METSSARLDSLSLCRLKWLLGSLLTLVSLPSALLLGSEDAVFFAVMWILVALFLAFPKQVAGIPAKLWNWSTPILVIIIVADFVTSGGDFVPSLVRTVAILLTFRALQQRTAREDLQLLLLAVFLLLVCGVLSMELLFALQLLAFVPLALLYLFIITLAESAEQPETGKVAIWEDFHPRKFAVRVGHAMDWRMLLVGTVSYATMVVMAALFFVLLPRFELGASLPFLKNNARSSLTGFSEEITFGEMTGILEDTKVALRVDVPDGRSLSAPYWRMLVLDAYTGKGFRMSEGARAQYRNFSDFAFAVESGGRSYSDPGSQDDWVFYLEGGVSRFLPMPGLFAAIRFQSRQDLQFSPQLLVLALREIPGNVLFYKVSGMKMSDTIAAVTGDEILFNAEPIPVLTDYRSVAYPHSMRAVPGSAENQKVLQNALVEIGEFDGDVSAFGDRIIRWLEPRGYSLVSSSPPGPEDSLLRWMAAGGPGHCELFAGAMVLLARQAGIPARVVVGFQGGDWNGYENYFMVRNRNAHAWVELLDPQRGWIRMDPTPARTDGSLGGDADEQFASIDDTWNAYLDSLRILWYRRIVNFDAVQQQELARNFRDWTRRTSEGLRDFMARWRDTLMQVWRDLSTKADSVTLGAGAVLVGIVVYTLWKFARGMRRSGAPKSRIVIHRSRIRAGQMLRKIHPLRASGYWLRQGEFEECWLGLQSIRYGDSKYWQELGPLLDRTKACLRQARQASRRKDVSCGTL